MVVFIRFPFNSPVCLLEKPDESREKGVCITQTYQGVSLISALCLIFLSVLPYINKVSDIALWGLCNARYISNECSTHNLQPGILLQEKGYTSIGTTMGSTGQTMYCTIQKPQYGAMFSKEDYMGFWPLMWSKSGSDHYPLQWLRW